MRSICRIQAVVNDKNGNVFDTLLELYDSETRSNNGLIRTFSGISDAHGNRDSVDFTRTRDNIGPSRNMSLKDDDLFREAELQ